MGQQRLSLGYVWFSIESIKNGGQRRYSLFALLLEHETKAWRGISIRQVEPGSPMLVRPQVEIEASGPKGSESGNIYGQGLGTDFLKPKKGRVKAIKDAEWNHIRIRAEGPRIRTWINGEAIIDLTNRDIYADHSIGMIGLQVHGVKNFTQPQEIAWKNIRIIEFTR